jgi:hypothetical protein
MQALGELGRAQRLRRQPKSTKWLRVHSRLTV